jgi:hypothetical protein
MNEIAPMVVGIAFFTMIAFIVRTVADGRRRREHLKTVTEFHNRLLDKLGSVSDFAQFLQTDSGGRLLDTLSTERGAAGPRDRIMRNTSAGIILLALGVALMFVGWMMPYDRGAFGAIGGIILSLGVGFLLSSAASFRLAKALGVLDQDAGARAPRA